MENSLSKIMLLKAKEYEYRQQSFPTMHLPAGKQLGFVAQELEAIFPELVKKNVHAVSSDEQPKSDETVILEIRKEIERLKSQDMELEEKGNSFIIFLKKLNCILPIKKQIN